MAVWDFTDYDIKDLFKIRDADNILRRYDLGMNDEARLEVDAEIKRRADNE